MRVAALLALLLAALGAEDPWRLEIPEGRATPVGGSARVLALSGDHRLALRVAWLVPGRYASLATAPVRDIDAFAAARAIPEVSVVINGGYFDRDRNPLGRLVVDGVERTPALVRAPLSGLAFSDGGGLQLGADVTVEARHAIQAGPFLIDPGGGFGIRRRDGPTARRSALAIAGDGTVLAVITTSQATLHAFAGVLQALPAALELPPLDAALNLDGGPSTGLVISGEEPVEPSGFVVSAWGFVPR